MPRLWQKLKSPAAGYVRPRPDGGYLRVWSASYGRSLKVWKYSVVDAIRRAGDRDTMTALATFALMVGGEYRRIANGKEIDD